MSVAVNVLLGHMLPLAITVVCVRDLARGLVDNPRTLLPWLGLLASLCLAVWKTASYSVNLVPGGVMTAVYLDVYITVMAMAALGAGLAYAGQKFSWKTVWVTAFLPLWLVDMALAGALLGPTNALRGVGGAGIVDALLAIPAASVCAAFACNFIYRKLPAA